MRTRKRRPTTFAALAALFLTLMIVSSVSAEKMKVSASWPPPESSMISESVKAYLDEVTKRTNGELTFEVLWGCALGAPPEQSDLLSSGAVQLGHFMPWFTPGKFPLANFEYVFPFGPTDYEMLVKARRQIRKEFPQLAEEAAKQNAILLFDPPGGIYDFMSKQPLRTIEDFKGQKVSLIGRYFGRWLPPGASAVVRPGHERYDLLRAGVVTIDLLPFDLLYSFKIGEVTKYYLEAGITTAFWGPLFMNLKIFNKLSPQTQKILLDTGKEMEMRAATEINPKWHDICFKAWKKAGMKFYKLPEKEKTKWCNNIKDDTPAEWSKKMDAKGLPGSAIVKRWQEITEEMGYEWPRKWGSAKK